MKKSILVFGMLSLVLAFAGAGCVSFSSKSTTSGPAGMFLSTDRGESWKQISALPTAEGVKNISNVNVYQLVADPQDPNALYMASRDSGLYYTYNGGQTWQKTGGPLSTGLIYSVAVHPKNKCEIYATNGRQVFKSDDCSRSWKEMFRESRSNILIASIAYSYFPPYAVYMAESNGDFLQSQDGGVSWNVSRRFKVRISSIAPSPLNEKLIYVITRSNGIYRSDDGGATWISLAEKMKKYSGALEYRRYYLHPTKQDTIYWISTYGILVSDTRGDSWSAYKLITPPGSVNIYSFAVNPKNDKEIYYTATVNDRSTFYKSIDGGQSWITRKLPSSQLPAVLWVHPAKDGWVYLGFTVPPQTKSQQNTNIFIQ